jgi:hypothetical protein
MAACGGQDLAEPTNPPADVAYNASDESTGDLATAATATPDLVPTATSPTVVPTAVFTPSPLPTPTVSPARQESSPPPAPTPVPTTEPVHSPTATPTSTPDSVATPVVLATPTPHPISTPITVLPPTPSVPVPPATPVAPPQPGDAGSPISNLPSLVTPVGDGIEVWEPVLTTGGQFSTISAPTAHDANVLALPNGGYRIYYGVEGHNVMSSFSNDGLTWLQDSGVRLTSVAFPAAISLPNGQVRIYYQKNMSIGSSISNYDGLTFTEEAGLRVASGELNGLLLDNLGAPSVVRLPNGKYRMYFRGGTEDASFWNGQKAYILSATSEDGLNFEVDQGFRVDPSQFSDGNSGAPEQYGSDKVHWVDGDEAVVGDDGRIRLYFVAGFCHGLCMGLSDDGLEFNSYQQVMSEESTPLNDLAGGVGRIPGDPTVLQIPGGPSYMYFGQGGHDVEPKELWGVYIAQLRIP